MPRAGSVTEAGSGQARAGVLTKERVMFRRLRICPILLALALLVPGVGQAMPSAADGRIAEPFAGYYAQQQGGRLLGGPVSPLVQVAGYPAQYFEKGRLEDHRGEVVDARWGFMYGRLPAELMVAAPQAAVSTTRLHYADLARRNNAVYRHPVPANYRGGVLPLPGGEVFVPYDPYLRAAPGFRVAPVFWAYISRADLFPAGWLHDVGLPLTDAIRTEVTRDGMARAITLQAFERAVLTYDPQNPPDWQVERGNIGWDAWQTAPAAGGGWPLAFDRPTAGERATLPLHVFAHAGVPGEQVTALLTWADGTKLTNRLPVLAAPDGSGLVIGNVDWINLLQPPQPRTGPATLTLRSAAGVPLLTRTVTVLAANDPDTQAVEVYWTVSGTERTAPQTVRVPRTTRIGTAALEALLWGPPTVSQIGYGTAIPLPARILSYPGRTSDWGAQVRLRSLTIENGVATADFSRELDAYGGGSMAVRLIREQITRTLQQFPTVRTVRIAIEGQVDGILQP
jgi:hypothetical protein